MYISLLLQIYEKQYGTIKINISFEISCDTKPKDTTNIIMFNDVIDHVLADYTHILSNHK